MPAYVPNPHAPGSGIDVVKLQGEDPLQVLEPYLLPDWMKRDTWSRREALMLLAGYNPSITRWSEVDDGFGQFPAGNIGYLDKLSDSMIAFANVSWRHPRFEEALEQFLTLADYARGGSLDERKTPAEWVAWAASKGLTPYWLSWAKRTKVIPDPRATERSDHRPLTSIGSVVGFELTSSQRVHNEQDDTDHLTISVMPGSVHLEDGRVFRYHSSSISTVLRHDQEKIRVYIEDTKLCDTEKNDTSHVPDIAMKSSWQVGSDEDAQQGRGVYHGGLVVLGVIDVPMPIRDNTSAHHLRPQSQHRYQEEEIKRALADLGIDPMALPARKPGKPGVKKATRSKLSSLSTTVFNKAWERLRASGEIRDE